MIKWSTVRNTSIVYGFITALLTSVVISFTRIGAILAGDIAMAEKSLIGVIFVGTMLWVIGGVYSPDDIVWPRTAPIGDLVSEYVDARTHLVARLLQALGGSVAAYAASAYYGIDTQKEHPGNLIGTQFMVFGLVTIALTMVIFPMVWLVKSKALDLSLKLLRAVLETVAYDPDDSSHREKAKVSQFDAAYARVLAVNEIQDALQQRALVISHASACAK